MSHSARRCLRRTDGRYLERMNLWRLILTVLTIVGAGVTIWGLVSAYFAAREEAANAKVRIATAERLEDEENAEPESSPSVHARYDKLYEAEGLVRPTRGNAAYLAAYESERLLTLTLTSTRSGLLSAGVGLVVKCRRERSGAPHDLIVGV